MLDKLTPLQKSDFKAIFRAMEGLPVTVRLLDPPLHEFLPTEEEVERDIENLKLFQTTVDNIHQLPAILKAIDPNLGSKICLDTMMVEDLEQLKSIGIDKRAAEKKTEVLRKIRAMKEVNPMLGHRGVRLGITYPDIYEMQVEAILEAAGELISENVDGLRMRFKAFPFQHHRMLTFRQGKGLGGRRGALKYIVDINFRPRV